MFYILHPYTVQHITFTFQIMLQICYMSCRHINRRERLLLLSRTTLYGFDQMIIYDFEKWSLAGIQLYSFHSLLSVSGFLHYLIIIDLRSFQIRLRTGPDKPLHAAGPRWAVNEAKITVAWNEINLRCSELFLKNICCWLKVNERFTDVIPWARLSLLQTGRLNLKAYGEELHWSGFIKYETTAKAPRCRVY